ncbi:two-component system response regulator VicR [Pedobacter sp. UYEF25]
MKKKIVLVQDNVEVLEIMDEALADEGFEVIASLAPKPLSEMEELKPDAIVIDDHIKGTKRGSEVIKEVKQNKKTEKVSAVLTSTSNKLAEQAKLCNADDYIQKPFELEEMISVVKKNT